MTATSLASLLFLDLPTAPKQCFEGKTCYLNDDNEYTDMLAWLVVVVHPRDPKNRSAWDHSPVDLTGLKTRSH